MDKSINNKTLKFSIHSTYCDILLLISFIVLFLYCDIDFGNNKGILFLSVAFIVYIFWQTLYSRNYCISNFVVKNNKLKLQTKKGLKIKRFDVDLQNIRNFQINVDVNYKRFYIGMFDINIKIDLNNGQQIETNNRTNQIDFIKFIAKVIKQIPNSRVFVTSNFDKGDYTKENLENFLNNAEQERIGCSISMVGMCIIITLVVMVLSIISSMLLFFFNK